MLGLGETQGRIRTREPPPQLTVHSDQALHAPHAGGRVMLMLAGERVAGETKVLLGVGY